jgi:ssDNA-binding replication factor A large subunit
MNFENSFKNKVVATTVEEIKKSVVPNSPRRSTSTLTCAVLNKSPIKPTRNGSMFSLNLCDSDQSTTIRAVCFNEDIFSKIQSKKTYDLQSFKIKQSFGNRETPELVLDNETKISLASSQVAIDQCFFTISQILRGETSNSRFLNVKAKVTAIDESRVVGTYPQNKTKRSVQIADTTGEIELILWRERADVIAFEDGNVLNLENIVVSKFNGKLNLTTAFESSITILDEEMTVARPTKRPLPKSNIISMEASVRAIKEFISTFSCMACRKQIDLADVQGIGGLISCPTCSCTFLKSALPPAQKCLILLSDNNQWFTAHTKVRFHL